MKAFGPLRGRSDELATALGVVRRTRTRRGGGVLLISGNPGIGKTALLAELTRQAEHLRLRVARAKCDEIAQASPGAPVLSLLRTGNDPLLSAEDFHQLTESATNPLALVDRIAGHLHTVATTNSVLLIVDDAQWADPVSRYGLRTLIPRLAGLPVVWALADRTGETALEVSGAGIVDVEHISLGPLSHGAIADIARDRLGHSINDDQRDLLDAAGGNPFLATQIIEGIARSADSGQGDGLPAEFHGVMRSRLSGLGSNARKLIDALAVAGHALSLVELSQICDVSPGPDYNKAVDVLVASGLVASTGVELDFTHDLVRQSLYQAIPQPSRRRLHARYADYFLTYAADPVTAAAHARAAVTVGDVPNARVMLAAAQALATTSAADAAGLALSAVQMLRPGQPEWIELGERAVAVLSTTQRANDTIEVVDRLRSTTDDVDVISRVETHAARALWQSARFEDMHARAGRAIEQVDGRPELVARFRAAQALASTRMIGADSAAQTAESALTEARKTGDHEALAFGLQAAGEAANAQRHHQLALKHFRELRSVTGISYLADEIMELQLLDRYDAAQVLLDAALDDSHANAEGLLPAVLYAQAKQHYNVGDLELADQVAASVVELGQLIGTRDQVIEATVMRAAIALLRAETVLAERRLDQVSSLLDDARPTQHPGVAFCQGWLSGTRGDDDGRLQIWSELIAEPAETRSYSAWWPCWMPLLFEAGMARKAGGFLESVLAIAEEGAAYNPDVATLSGVAVNLRGLWKNDLDTVGEGAEILRRSPRRVMRAIGAESYGFMLLRAGQRQAGLSQLDDAWDDYDQMGAVSRRAAIQRVMRDAGARRAKWSSSQSQPARKLLTDAERRVVYLIANGCTDKSAAKSLGISVNTVGTHIRSVYTKLGVQSRVQLANALRDRGELD